jgi:hypothetical protein
MRRGVLLCVAVFLVLYGLISIDGALLRTKTGKSEEDVVIQNVQKDFTHLPSKPVGVLEKATRAAFKGGFYAASAGFIQVVALMWLRTTVNYQYRYGVPMVAAIQQLYQQGGIARFYKGITFALIIGPLSKFGAIAANEWSKAMVVSWGMLPGAAELYATVLGTVLTVFWRVLLMPIETCKTVLQVDGG